MGLITVAQGCVDLECLHIGLTTITNEAMECIGTHLKNLRDFHMIVGKTTTPLDNGVRLMLIGCSKLERLGIHLCPGGLADVGLGITGKNGRSGRFVFLVGVRGLLERVGSEKIWTIIRCSRTTVVVGETGVTGDEHRRSVAVTCDQREIWYSNANLASSVGEQAGEHYGVGSSTEMALDVTGEEVVDPSRIYAVISFVGIAILERFTAFYLPFAVINHVASCEHRVISD
nr:hypothetical protein [Tanacetum cinerariifolium]